MVLIAALSWLTALGSGDEMIIGALCALLPLLLSSVCSRRW
jgi:hypothetical protein